MKAEEKEREKVREEVLKQIRKQGKDLVVDYKNVEERPAVPSSSLSLNLLLGIGGLPQGRIVEIFGPQGGGKTLIALDFIANAQREGKLCAFIDAEHALDLKWAQTLGVNLDKLDLIMPEYGEQALDIVEKMVASNAYGVIVLDSVAALLPKAEMEGTVEEVQNRVGLVAKMMSVGLRKITGIAHKTGTGLLFVNQVRVKPGVVYGDPETTPGGDTLKFYSSIRLRVSRVSGKANIFQDGNGANIGHRIKVAVKKSKVAPNTGNSAEFDLYYLKGIDAIGDVIRLAKEANIIKLRAEEVTYSGKEMSVDDLRKMLVDDKVLRQQFIATISETLKYGLSVGSDDKAETVNEETGEIK